ncbi:hypothetical protein SH1V18_24440 [Vallitalea longa]|uniref:Amidohydrolase-related domain-containing protein n=1 Tax=Vallitalea longa TaxID=2936439 RepID=A0A9W5YDK5_9FIRM|nr:TatD family hydrolase [Vallitalea longa]GKX29964.1 hypothetical protein SH1V18_24440 [Vallitalea longa]
MKIIDAHVHFSEIDSFIKTAKDISLVDYSSDGYNDEFTKNNVVMSIGMGLEETGEGNFPDSSCNNPMLLDLETRKPDNMNMCIGINPDKLIGINKDEELSNIEKYIINKEAVGLKIYAGYYHYHVYDHIYTPIYELAKRYGMPIVIHSGDTYSERGLLKFSQPLDVDEIAVKYRGVNFIIAHLGDPWVMDCAEVIYKNSNVYADISGLIVGDKKEVKRVRNRKLFVEHIKRALVYANDYKKILYGSDWPLVDTKAYIEFVKKIIPRKYHEDVFYNNARKVFNIK